MKKIILITAVVIAATNIAFSQGTAINNAGNPADSSALLDLSSTTQGLLIPRMTEAQKNSVPRPAPSLMIYQTDGTQPGYYFNAGDKTTKQWVYIGADDMGNHTATDSLNMSMEKIVNLATCTYNFDAANKLYVDSKVGAGGTGGGGAPTGCSPCITALSHVINNGATSTWGVCSDSCHILVENGYNDWRMPTFEEVTYYRTIFDPPTGGWISNYVWTSTHGVANGNYWYIFYELLGALANVNYTGPYACRCVR